MKFFKYQSGDGPNFLAAYHISCHSQGRSLTSRRPLGLCSSNSLPNPISYNTNPEPLSGRERTEALPTSSPISFWSQTAPRGGKSAAADTVWRESLSAYRSSFSFVLGSKCGQISSHLPTSAFHFHEVLSRYNTSTMGDNSQRAL